MQWVPGTLVHGFGSNQENLKELATKSWPLSLPRKGSPLGHRANHTAIAQGHDADADEWSRWDGSGADAENRQKR